MLDRSTPTASTVTVYLVVVATAVVTAAVVAPVATGVLRDAGHDEPVVAVLSFRGTTDTTDVSQLAADLRDARTNDSVAAVVIRIDSFGGPVGPSEEFYLAVNRTAREMPVVTYVEGGAASGGYYGIVASDEIVVKPSSEVGSVGVVVGAPIGLIELVDRQQESFVRSGPDKAQISADSIRSDIETLQSAFVGTVLRHRKADLELSREEIASGDVYLGPRAVEAGLADRVGDIGTAIERAAVLSDRIEDDRYDVTYVDPSSTSFSVPFANSDVERIEGNVVYVDSDLKTHRAVRYYAVWGVPVPEENASSTDGQQ